MSTMRFYRTLHGHMFATLPQPPPEAVRDFMSQAADVFKEMGARGIEGALDNDHSSLTPADCWLLRLLAEMVAAVIETTPKPTTEVPPHDRRTRF